MTSVKKASKKPSSASGHRRLVADEFVSMDGVLQAPGAPEEDPESDFRLGGWSMTYWDELMDRTMGETMSKPSELVLGRKTYDIFAAYWPTRSDRNGRALNAAVKYVASRTARKLEWENAKLLEGDVASAVKDLKQRAGPPLHVIGSGNLLQTLLKNDLVDELEIWVFPVVLGSGKRLFGDGAIPTAWRLTRSITSGTGVLLQHYERAGEIVFGRPP